MISVMLPGIVEQSADTFQNGVQSDFNTFKIGGAFIRQRAVFLMLRPEIPCAIPQTGETESENTVPIRYRMVKVRPNCDQSGILLLSPGIADGIFQILFIYCAVVAAETLVPVTGLDLHFIHLRRD